MANRRVSIPKPLYEFLYYFPCNFGEVDINKYVTDILIEHVKYMRRKAKNTNDHIDFLFKQMKIE